MTPSSSAVETLNQNNTEVMILRRFLSTTSKPIVFSGIQPTGVMHLGNYFGAVKQWVTLQDSHDCLFSLADLHAISLPVQPVVLKESILTMTACLLGCGIEPDKCILLQQSRNPFHGQLSWILSTMTTMKELSGLPQFQNKSLGLKEIPVALFAYPVLQAADILLYKSNLVPVGDDNLQQINLCQHLAEQFNNRFNVQVFPRPSSLVINSCSRIKSLRHPEKKMSKSDGDEKSRIEILDSPEDIVAKVKKAVTDCTSAVTFDPEKRPGVANLLVLDSLVSGKNIEKIVEESSRLDTSQYKTQVADRIIAFLNPIRSKTFEFRKNPSFLNRILSEGKDKALERAEKTMKEVYELIGFR